MERVLSTQPNRGTVLCGVYMSIIVERPTVYRVALKQPRGSSLVITHRVADIQVTSDRTVTLGLVPVEPSTSISGSNTATYVVNASVS